MTRTQCFKILSSNEFLEKWRIHKYLFNSGSVEHLIRTVLFTIETYVERIMVVVYMK